MKIPESPPPLLELLSEFQEKNTISKILDYYGNLRDRKYYHWDKLKYLEAPEGVSHREWWGALKLSRNSSRREIPLKDKEGNNFFYNLPDLVLEKLHTIDKNASGIIEMPEPIANAETRDKYIQSSLIEEAITSSQLEGAATTREVAKEMIRMGRKPINEGELMILNNYFAMRHVREIKGKVLTKEMIEKMHLILTKNLLVNDETQYRVMGDGIRVYDNQDNKVLHDPPEANELKARMIAFCHFANSETEGVFMHPVLKAIILHFWLAYDHPFKDGNGRTARALFYWYMLSKGFWLFEYVSISTILKKAPSKYARSFLYTETDDNDLTYFIVYQLDVICRAIDSLHDYIKDKTEEYRKTASLLKPSSELNHRQIAILTNALKHPNQNYTIDSHRKSHDVTYQTARTDLLLLHEKELLTKHKYSKAFVFRPAVDLHEKIQNL